MSAALTWTIPPPVPTVSLETAKKITELTAVRTSHMVAHMVIL